jgi:tetratricopeptide (TPR) repeat protein
MLATRKAQELDVVELTEDLPEYSLKRGERGTVVTVFDEPDEAYDLEFVDESGTSSRFGYSVKPEQIINIDAMAWEAYVKGVDLLKSGATLEARRKLREAVRLNARLSGALLNSVLESFGTSDDFDGLLEALRFVCELNPDYELARTNLVSAYLNRGIQEARIGNVEGALQFFYPAMMIATSDEARSWVKQNIAAAHTSLGIQAYARARLEDDADEALKHLRNASTNMARACSIEPNEDTRRNLGLAYAYVGNGLLKNREFEKAAGFFQVAEDSGLRLPGLHNNHGVALAFSGALKAAIEQFEAVLELEPTHANAQFNMAQVRAVSAKKETSYRTEEITDFQFHEVPVSQPLQYTAAA